MSPLYGAPLLYGSPLVYGPDVGPGALDLQRKVLGGWAPWITSNVTPWRSRCVTLGAYDPDGVWLDLPIVGLSTGSEQQVRQDGLGLPVETLTLELADPTGAYLEGGRLAAFLAPNALVGLVWTVTTPAGTLTRRSTPYRIQQGLTRSRDRWGRAVLRTQAVDWLRDPLTRPVGASVGITPGGGVDYNGGAGTGAPSGSGPLAVALTLATVWTVDTTWLDVAVGLLSIVAGGGQTPATWLASAAEGTRTGGLVPAPPTGATPFVFADWLANGMWPTYGTLLNSICATFGWRCVYDAAGYGVVLNSDARRDSGYVVSANPTVGGAFPVPWEQLTRTPTRAQATRVEVWYSWLGGGTPPSPIQVQAGSATSASRLNPHTPPLSHTEFITSNTAIATGAGGSIYDSAAGIAARRLQDYLGQADPITLTVDSACPPPTVGEELRICLPDDAIDGYWRFTGATAPLGVGAARWDLTWMADV